MAIEQRRHYRLVTYLDVNYQSASGRREARTSDISMGGCFIDTISHQEAGQVLNLRMLLPGGHWMTVLGKVTYCYVGMGFGVQFLDLSEGQQKLLGLLVECLNEPLKSEFLPYCMTPEMPQLRAC